VRAMSRLCEEQTAARMTDSVYAVVVTHRRPDELAKSLDAVSAQSRSPDHLVVVDNDDDARVRDIVNGQPIATTYIGSRRNLGGAGGFALGMLQALALGADWVWLADDDGRPLDSEVLGTLLACAEKYELAEVSPMVCDMADPQWLAFPLRRGLAWRRRVNELRTGTEDLLPGIASLFNGALFRRHSRRSASRIFDCSCVATKPNCTGGWCARRCRSAPA
jgi:rhamnopyranosyl-N-acetylglucosaminyl-diphospho-decaprenol beta-1,3/1,4-galactofuranosyltransferase